MKRTCTASPLLAACLLGLALGLATPLPAADPTSSGSAEKAKQALAVLQSDAPPGEKAIACKRLAVFGGPEAVPTLAGLLSNADLASWARIPLEVIPGPAADDALREALGKLQGNLLIGVINSVGVRGDAKAVDTLVVHLKDADAGVASAAAASLGKIGGAAAAGALEAALASAPVNVRSTVAEGLVLCAERSASAGQAAEAVRVFEKIRQADVPKQRKLEATRGLILARQEQGLSTLLETLRSPDQAMFAIALRTARELPGRAVTQALAKELAGAPAERQSPILLAITDRRDELVWPAVLASASQGSKPLRLVAISALERFGNPAAGPVLIEGAADADKEIAKAASTALARLPGKSLDAEIAGRLPKSTGATRLALVQVAGQRRLVAAQPELFKIAGDTEADVRNAAIKALGEIVGVSDLPALADLLGKAKSDDDVAEVEAALDSACTRLTDKPACAAPLLARLSASQPAARAAILRVLGTTATPESLAAVRGALKDGDKDVSEAAFRVLADWADPAALPALQEVLRGTATDTQRTLAMRGAVRLLGTANQPAASTVKSYADLLAQAKRADDRKLVLSGLGGVADPSALTLVEPLLADAAVRKEAEAALLGIAQNIAAASPVEAKAAATRLQKESADPGTRDRAEKLLKKLN